MDCVVNGRHQKNTCIAKFMDFSLSFPSMQMQCGAALHLYFGHFSSIRGWLTSEYLTQNGNATHVRISFRIEYKLWCNSRADATLNHCVWSLNLNINIRIHGNRRNKWICNEQWGKWEGWRQNLWLNSIGAEAFGDKIILFERNLISRIRSGIRLFIGTSLLAVRQRTINN